LTVFAIEKRGEDARPREPVAARTAPVAVGGMVLVERPLEPRDLRQPEACGDALRELRVNEIQQRHHALADVRRSTFPSSNRSASTMWSCSCGRLADEEHARLREVVEELLRLRADLRRAVDSLREVDVAAGHHPRRSSGSRRRSSSAGTTPCRG
jgi:hypothetical protein